MDLQQEIRKEVSFKHTEIKQQPYVASVHNAHINQLQHNITQLQTDMKSLKEAINTPHTQYAAPLDTSPVVLQQQLSKMKEDIEHLQQMTCPNTYSASPGNYRNFRTTDGLGICRRCNQVGHFACTCPGNLPPPRAPTHYQNHRHNYVPPGPSQHPRLSYTSNCPSSQYSQRPSYRSHVNQRNPIGYPYPQDATYTSPSRRSSFSPADQTDNKYQARWTNIPGQHNNYSNVIQNHPLQDQQCLHPPINVDHIHNTYTPPIHTPYTYHSSSRLTVDTNQPNHKINTEPVTIPARVNTMMTNPCTLPRSGNSIFELSKQHFAHYPVESTPVTINAENDNLVVHFINHSDRDIVAPKHTYVEVMEKVQESDRDNLSNHDTTPEPVSQDALSECLVHNDLLPSQRQSMYTPSRKLRCLRIQYC